jgi:hypothetical protein
VVDITCALGLTADRQMTEGDWAALLVRVHSPT